MIINFLLTQPNSFANLLPDPFFKPKDIGIRKSNYISSTYKLTA